MKIYIPNTGKWRVRIHDYDTWSLYDTLGKIIAPCLKQIKKMKHGIPMSCFPSLPEGEYNYSDEQHAEAEKKWNEILDKMIWAMENISKDPITKMRPDGMTYKQWVKVTDDHIFNKTPYTDEQQELFRLDRLEREKFDHRIQEGCELLGKHFRSLWD